MSVTRNQPMPSETLEEGMWRCECGVLNAKGMFAPPHYCFGCGAQLQEDLVSTDDTRTAYVTKYALTQGIHVHEVRLGSSHESWDDDKPFVYTTGRGMAQQFRLGKDAFFTENEALVAAEKMRQNKLASLAKSVEKLRNLEIKVKR